MYSLKSKEITHAYRCTRNDFTLTYVEWLLQSTLEHYPPLLQYLSRKQPFMDQTLATKHTLTKY